MEHDEIQSLPNEVLLKIFNKHDNKHKLKLVCKEWYDIITQTASINISSEYSKKLKFTYHYDELKAILAGFGIDIKSHNIKNFMVHRFNSNEFRIWIGCTRFGGTYYYKNFLIMKYLSAADWCTKLVIVNILTGEIIKFPTRMNRKY